MQQDLRRMTTELCVRSATRSRARVIARHSKVVILQVQRIRMHGFPFLHSDSETRAEDSNRVPEHISFKCNAKLQDQEQCWSHLLREGIIPDVRRHEIKVAAK